MTIVKTKSRCQYCGALLLLGTNGNLVYCPNYQQEIPPSQELLKMRRLYGDVKKKIKYLETTLAAIDKEVAYLENTQPTHDVRPVEKQIVREDAYENENNSNVDFDSGLDDGGMREE